MDVIALLDGDHAPRLQRLYGLPDRPTADLRLLCHLVFGGQALPWARAAADDVLPEALDDLFDRAMKYNTGCRWSSKAGKAPLRSPAGNRCIDRVEILDTTTRRHRSPIDD